MFNENILEEFANRYERGPTNGTKGPGQHYQDYCNHSLNDSEIIQTNTTFELDRSSYVKSR